MTNMQYSKSSGFQRLNEQPSTTLITIEPPTIKRNAPRSTRKDINYDEDEDASYFNFMKKKNK